MASIRKRGYYPLPLRRIYILKKNGKKRPLGIPTMNDRVMQAIHLLTLDPVAECLADPHSYGFRRERSCADAIGQCFIVLAKGHSPQWVLEGDIKSCFDRINHEWLMSHAPMDREMLQKWLKCGYVEKSVFHDTEEGTPQGGIISPALANLALDGMQRLLKDHFSNTYAIACRNKVNMIRYADDFVITGSSKELLENEVKPLIVQFLRERGLELSTEKTIITHIEDGFDFLGQNVRKYNGKLIIQPSKRNVADFLADIREVVKGHKAIAAGHLVYLLNQKIRGWAIYHRHVCAKETFKYVDFAVFKVLWCMTGKDGPDKNPCPKMGNTCANPNTGAGTAIGIVGHAGVGEIYPGGTQNIDPRIGQCSVFTANKNCKPPPTVNGQQCESVTIMCETGQTSAQCAIFLHELIHVGGLGGVPGHHKEKRGQRGDDFVYALACCICRAMNGSGDDTCDSQCADFSIFN